MTNILKLAHLVAITKKTILATAEVRVEKQNNGFDCPKCGTVNLQLSHWTIAKGGIMITSLFNLKIHVTWV